MDEGGRARMAGGRMLRRPLTAIVFCAVCIGINVLGAQLAIVLKLPIYLDSLGTVLSAMLGGMAPGIVVGYLTNLINGAMDPSMLNYGIVNVLVAISAAYFSKHGWFRSLRRTLLAICAIAIIAAVVGAVVTYYLQGQGMGGTVAADLAERFYDAGALGAFGAQLSADFFIELLDKTLIVLLAVIIWHLLSDSFRSQFDFAPWMQAPLSEGEMRDALDARPRGVPLRAKFVFIVAAIMVVVAVATAFMSYLMFHTSMIETESANAEGITDLMADIVEADRVPDYLAHGENAPGYKEVEAKLADIRESFDGVEYVYVYQIREDGCHVVFDLDSDDVPGSDPGTIVDFDESFAPLLPTLLAGAPIDPIVTNDTYGWLLTVYKPLIDSAGETACYVCVDISMNHLSTDEMSFLTSIIAIFAAFFIMVCAIVLWLARYGIILPVNSIARATGDFMVENESDRSRSFEHLGEIGIRTGDEVENLYDAVCQMARETVEFIADAQEKNDTIERMQSNLIMVMADLVESRDKFTGDHVRHTAAYTKIIMNQMRREGIYPDQLSNEFISNVYKSAPLHDVGKIVVSDTILNKPGPFTDEEYEIMKSHTIAGAEILERAKGAVSEASYLDEAVNLAAYHHEKWNGTGYPYGLAGEDIPLSARIMAVADVFDALVSKRSYKEGFPIEKAFAIIEEGVGTHFDPQVANAFLHARSKARAIAEGRGAEAGSSSGEPAGDGFEAGADSQ